MKNKKEDKENLQNKTEGKLRENHEAIVEFLLSIPFDCFKESKQPTITYEGKYKNILIEIITDPDSNRWLPSFYINNIKCYFGNFNQDSDLALTIIDRLDELKQYIKNKENEKSKKEQIKNNNKVLEIIKGK